MVADLALRDSGARSVERVASQGLHQEILLRLEKGAIGTRRPDGTVAIRRSEPAGCLLYGPYLHLPQGRYRLRFRAGCFRPRMTAHPVLGVEIIVLSRFQQQWKDFTAADLAGGSGALDFEVPPEHSLEGGNEGRYEFRFFHLGNAALAIASVDLEKLPDDAPPPESVDPPAGTSQWRLLGRLDRSWLGRRTSGGALAASRHEPAGCLLYGGWPYLRLPSGRFRLVVRARCGTARRPDRPVLGIAVSGESRWRSRSWTMRLARRPETTGIELVRRDIGADELGGGPVALDFTVPADLSLEAGADAPFDIRLYHHGNASLTVEAVDLIRLDDPIPEAASAAAPGHRPVYRSGRRKVVIIGNCQSETLRQGFTRIETLSRLFDVKYHFVQLPKNLHEFAARDLETCDIVLIQDIRLWDEFPLRDRVRPGADAVRFPLVRFASPWPFDAWNGPGDNDARAREGPNLTFPYLDGLLARLRQEIPDREARFQAYRALDLPGLVNYRRLHELEIRRLDGMDRKFGFALGAFILENFRNRRLFHTTVRPNWQVFNLLMQSVARSVGVTAPIALDETYDAMLRNPQIPVHPKVARDLGVQWADEATRYLNRGLEVTWESYVRSYIEHYG
ncbi:MAG: WcbI family polysaccharide biosynthesis putative acetyltransferase [Alphaproteobacteria bacterium]